MPEKEVVHYIKGQLRNGHSIGKIKHKLFSVGHKKADVEEAVGHIYHKQFTNKIMLTSSFLVLLIALMLLLPETENIEFRASEIVQSVEPSPVSITGRAVYGASVAGDISVCNQLNPEEQSKCRDLVYYKKSRSENNVELCNLIQSKNYKASCFDFYYLEKARTDKSFCDKIVNSRIKATCMG
jgi:hypothetical protein|tara:strand:- start:266 stop:814 length:549 start_codon:yes stop_codon:yes gene_type:complete